MLPLAPSFIFSLSPRHRRQGGLTRLFALGVLALASACSGNEAALDASGEEVATASSALGTDLSTYRTAENGIIGNGIIGNGIIGNGLALRSPLSNGLAVNGLGAQGLASAAFTAWFRAYPEAEADMAMHYLVACAVPEGEQRTWTHPDTGTSFTWEGRLGLAPDWALGHPATEAEQQLVSGCLAAMVNKFGVHVSVSVRGQDGRGQELPVSEEEAAFTVREAAFFGNLFTGEGVFVCSDRAVLNPAESSARACGLSSQASGVSVECPPLVHLGLCPSLCQLAAGQGHYARCTTGGRTYLTVSTRLREQDVYRCGDGVCQFTESCDSSALGGGRSYDSCAVDCGRCQ